MTLKLWTGSAIQPSASRPARRNPTGVHDAIQMSGPGRCAGVGVTNVSAYEKCLPSNENRSPRQLLRMTSMASSVRDARSVIGMPNASKSCGW